MNKDNRIELLPNRPPLEGCEHIPNGEGRKATPEEVAEYLRERFKMFVPVAQLDRAAVS